MELDPAAKVAINSYLARWLAVLGIANLVALAAAFSYIFFVLPKYAVDEARQIIQASASASITEVDKAVNSANVDALLASRMASQTQNDAKQAEANIEKVKQDISKLQVDMENVSHLNAVEIEKTIAELQNSGQVFPLINDVRDLKQSCVRLGSRVRIASALDGLSVLEVDPSGMHVVIPKSAQLQQVWMLNAADK